MILFIISFIAGVLTVLAPCILPLLPVIVGGSLLDGRVDIKKALTIITSLGISVLAFTLLLKASTLLIAIPPAFWQWFSGSIIVSIGVLMVFPALYGGKLLAKWNSKAQMLLGKGERQKSFLGDILVGAALGPVFSTCSPTYFIVLATVLPVSPSLGVLYMLAYIVGLCGALLLVTFVGQKIMATLGVASDPRSWFKKALGVLFIAVGIFVITGMDKALQTTLLEKGFYDVTQLEQKLLQLFDTKTIDPEAPSDAMLNAEQKATYYKKAPEISTPDGFVNSNGEPISLESLRGEVVLLDVWTYSCINCQRTLPYLNAWYEKYKDEGLVIVGLHTPEFAFEKVQKNVEDAVEKFGIQYPVVLDNDYSTWIEYGNRYWPRKYLIDIDGYIVYDHIGEGGYEETERAIRQALMEKAAKEGETILLQENLVNEVEKKSGVESPEIYFGALRNTTFANGMKNAVGEQTLALPPKFERNKLYLDGTWNITEEYAENWTEGSINFVFKANEVYMVASAEMPVEVGVYQDGELVKTILVHEDGLYTLIENETSAEHTLQLRIKEPGLKAFTFTFG